MKLRIISRLTGAVRNPAIVVSSALRVAGISGTATEAVTVNVPYPGQYRDRALDAPGEYALPSDSRRVSVISTLAIRSRRASAIAATGSHDTPLDFTFSGDEARVTVRITCQAGAGTAAPAASTVNGISVNWSADGSRLTCTIQQPTAS